MSGQGKNLTYLRASNQGVLFKHIITHGAVSKQALSRELNLTPMSISYITADLLEKGYLYELPAETVATPGRPANKLALVSEKLLAVSVSVSRRSVRASLMDIGGYVHNTVRTALTGDITADILTEIVVTTVQTVKQDHAVLGIGVSCVGMVDIHSGTVVSITDFYNIADWRIAEILSNRFSLPVFVAEDMKAAALAESYYGVGKAYHDFVYVGITHGIGAAVIANGKLLAGNRGFSGELGHTTLYPNGEHCACGNVGCAELYLSVPKVLKQAAVSSWDELVKKPNTPTMQRFLGDLSILLTNVVNLFDPQAVILGHEGALLPKDSYQTLQQTLNERTMTRWFKTVDIIPSALAQNITAKSGGALVFDRLFGGEFKL